LLKRTSIKNLNQVIENNSKWNILDIGCGYRAHPKASIIADIQDFSNYYKERKFVKINGKNLPFKDKEFDFVIASHVIEHIEDFEFFIQELERVSSKGYIELPSRLGDNLVFENKNDHIWWFCYDDTANILKASKRNQIIEPFITVSTAKLLEKIFRESLVLGLFWDHKIDYEIDNSIKHHEVEKISFFKIFRKYLSKKIRTFYK
tara:strand:- start:165 stop:779 length:615 start_codon:yes stop_codon:yes gene_type:complete